MPYGREIVTSRQNPTVQRLCALLDKKERRKSRLFRIDGRKLLGEAIACGAVIDSVFLREDREGDLYDEVRASCPQARIVLLSRGVFDKISDERAPEGIVATVAFLDSLHREADEDDIRALARSGKKVMAFESLRDPGNLGTVIRSASAFGVDTLLLSSDCADIYNPRTLRGAMGALFSREVLFCRSLPEALVIMSGEGRRVLAATLSDGALPLCEVGLAGHDVVVIGNEGHGLGEEAVSAADLCVILPMNSGPGVESLNAATAASVFMWEQMRAGS